MATVQHPKDVPNIYPCFVITGEDLKVNEARLNFEGLDFKITQINPVYLTEYPVSFPSKSSYLKMRRKLVLAELGCAKAHLNAYQTFLETSAKLALVLESDASLYSDGMENFRGAFESIVKFDSSDPSVYSFLSESALISQKIVFENFHSVIGFPSQTVAYVINRSAAKQFLSSNRNLEFVADWPKAKYVSFYLNIENIFRHGSGENKSLSLIETSRNLARPHFLNKSIMIVKQISFYNYFIHGKYFDSIGEYTVLYVLPIMKWWLARIGSTRIQGKPRNLRKVTSPLVRFLLKKY